MRVTRIPGDHNDIGDKPCRVYLNGVEILDWTVADDFRRVVETPDGARFGAVRIDMQPEPICQPPELTCQAPVVIDQAPVVSDAAPAVSRKVDIHIPARKRKASK